MIIIPTEKRFDWKHAPIALITLVILNVFIYFIPQANDNKVIASAVVEYKTQDYLVIEWPFLKTYLINSGQKATLEYLKKQFDQQKFNQVISHIIFDSNFYRYLRHDQYDFFTANDVGDWFSIREEINHAIQSTTIVSYGLISADIKLLSVISYQFLHASAMHLLGNLFFLVICGFALEAAIGHWRFLLFYLLSGIAGGLLYAFYNSSVAMPLVGASGAISGTMAMYLAIFRLKKIEFFYWFFIFVGYFKAPALLILLFYIGKELFQLVSDTQSNTAFLAHVGGFIAGAILIFMTYWVNRFFFNINFFNQDYIDEDQNIDSPQEKKALIYEFLDRYQFDAVEKVLERIQQESHQDFDFELLLIRYNVEKIDKKKNFKKNLVALLLTKQPSQQQACRLEKIWQENELILQDLDSVSVIEIAIGLTQSRSPKQAALLFEHVYDRFKDSNDTNHDMALAVLTKKLADAFGAIDDFPQQQKYAALKAQLLAGNPP